MEQLNNQNSPSSPHPEFRKCPYCAETIRWEAIICRYCDRSLDKPVEPKLLTIQSQNNQSSQLNYYSTSEWKCPKCGGINPSTKVICMGCNTPRVQNITLNNLYKPQGSSCSGWAKWRLIIGIITVIIAIIGYTNINNAGCSGQGVDNWATSTMNRFDESNNDLDYISNNMAGINFAAYQTRAEKRYNDQKAINTPNCLSGIQEKVLQVFYNEWKSYEAAALQNFTLSVSYMDQASAARNGVEEEIKKVYPK